MRKGEFPTLHPNLLGDLVISVETLSANQTGSASTKMEMIILLMVHGVLHLIGYEHEGTKKGAREMVLKQKELFQQVIKTEQVYAKPMDVEEAVMQLELARSEMSYTDQRPAEYVSSVLAGAIAEGYTGPVFIQGDHFQVQAKNYAANPDKELEAIRNLIREAIEAGFYNIDIDASTLVKIDRTDLKEQPGDQRSGYGRTDPLYP
jgi:tagatose-1,6-bisphosphate aldolase non-catalytic subunit AgaZ/GatZ